MVVSQESRQGDQYHREAVQPMIIALCVIAYLVIGALVGTGWNAVDKRRGKEELDDVLTGMIVFFWPLPALFGAIVGAGFAIGWIGTSVGSLIQKAGRSLGGGD